MVGLTNMDLVPSTKRPPSGGSVLRIGVGEGAIPEAVRGAANAGRCSGGCCCCCWGCDETKDLDDPAPGDCGGSGVELKLERPER